MFFSKAVVYILPIFTFIESGVAFPTEMRPKREQYEVLWEGNGENIMELSPRQDKDVTHFPTEEYVETTKKFTTREVTNIERQYQRSSPGDRHLNRNKRKFYPYLPYTKNGIQLRSRNLWQPTEYPLQQPYHIPVYGKEGSTPVYITHQPMFVNLEDLPQTSEKLPSDEESENQPFAIHIDDKPIWGTTKTTEPSESNQISSFPMVEDDGDDLEYDQFVQPTIERPETEPGSRSPRSPNNCVLAIVSCCTVTSNEVNINCFEQFGCTGPFWDVNPCEKEFDVTLKVSVLILALVCFIEGGVVFPSRIRSKRDQYENTEIRKDGASEDKAEIESTQSEDATDVTHIPKQVVEHSTSKYSISEIVNNAQFRSFLENAHHVEDQQRRLGNYGDTSKRRLYPTYKNRGPHFRSRHAWKPSEYPLEKPYYIPVYGIEGSTPLYISQESFYAKEKTTSQNSGKLPSTVDSEDITPISSSYLPNVVTSINGKKKRFTNNLIDDMPVWDAEDTLSASSTVEPEVSKFPQEYDTDSAQYNEYNNLPPYSNGETTSTTTESSSEDNDTPNNCVLAIVSCCSVSSDDVNLNCFKQFRCFIPFWDVNPCSTEFVKYAVERAVNFYQKS
ncbi:hypothetical protein WA026_005984 [Henosepilachna vigintioctopunctata]|uniref:Uncharacterized protein n=1 Tax=Henosepilachna vigintioctopunctata TaxID=420089 RepID=A0AAW1U4K5_9CUCU